MKNYVQDGRFLDVVAPGGGLTSGAFYKSGAVHGVVQSTVLVGETTTIDTKGVSIFAKETSQAWLFGDVLYYDAANARFTKIAAGNLQVGFAAADAVSADATGKVALGDRDGLRTVVGQSTTVTAVDTVATGLAVVLSAVANLEDVPVAGADRAQAFVGNQSGAPVAGSIQIKTFKPTATADTAPIAATTFTRKVNWIAVGY